MRKLLVLAILCLRLNAAALNAGMAWEVWPTSGSDSNSGGYDNTVSVPGFNWSTQTSPALTYTDLTVGATTTQATSAIHPFGNCIVGSGLCGNTILVGTAVSGTCTAGTYEVLSTSTITATLNAAFGTAGSVCNAVLGGAKATISGAYSVAVASNSIWVKATGTYTETSTLTVSSVNPTPMYFTGYTNVHSDGGLVTWTTATNSTNLITVNGAVNVWFKNFTFTNTAATTAVGLYDASSNSSDIVVQNSSFSGFSNAVLADYNVAYVILGLVLDNCEITGSTSDGIGVAGTTRILDSYIHGNAGSGVRIINADSNVTVSVLIAYSVVSANSGTAGILVNNADSLQGYTTLEILNSAIIGNTGPGISDVPRTGGSIYPSLLVWNTDLDSNGTYAIDQGAAAASLAWADFRNNSYWNNTSGNFRGSSALTNDLADVFPTGDPFVSRLTGNFSLNNTTGAGALLRGAGYPGAVGWGSGNTGYIDIGAFQHNGSGGGGSGGQRYGFFGYAGP